MTIGNDYIGHNYIGHNYIAQNFIGSDYIDHNYLAPRLAHRGGGVLGVDHLYPARGKQLRRTHHGTIPA